MKCCEKQCHNRTLTCNAPDKMCAIQCHLEEKLYRESNNSCYLLDSFLSNLPCRSSCGETAKPNQPRVSFKITFKNSAVWIVFVILFCHCIWPSAAKYSSNKQDFLRKKNLRRNFDESEKPPDPRCEKIEIPQCKDIGYNFTDMTHSPANMVKQSDAAPAVKEFTLLFDSACAAEMKLLVCSIYTPICLPEYPNFLPPCRHICERAKHGCGPLLAQYEVKWPDLLHCSNYPVYSRENPLCLHFNRTLKEVGPTINSPETLRIPSTSKLIPPLRTNTSNQISNQSKINYPKNDEAKCYCRSPMIKIEDNSNPMYNKVTTGSISNCAFPCRSPYFDKEDLQFVQSWITTWAIFCFFTTLATVATFLVDVNRYNYPERPVIFLSICNMFVSMGFLIRVVAGHEAVACGWGTDRVLYHVTGPFLCSTSFLLIYFFGMAGAMWWVTLTMTWLMAAGLKWGNEGIAKCSKYFHIASWFIPGLQTAIVLVTSSVEGDALAGICYVGTQDIINLNRFVLGPLIVYLTMGGLFLLLGFINLYRIRSSIKKMGTITQPLDKLIARIGFFSLMYFILSATVVACHFYEQQNHDTWATSFNCSQSPLPQLGIHIVKYTVTLLIGVATSLWICSRKTIASWIHFYHQSKEYICGPVGLMAWFKQQGKKTIYQHSDLSPCEKNCEKLLNSVNALDIKDNDVRKAEHLHIETFSRESSTICTDLKLQSPSSTGTDSQFRSFVRIEPSLMNESVNTVNSSDVIISDCVCSNRCRIHSHKYPQRSEHKINPVICPHCVRVADYAI